MRSARSAPCLAAIATTAFVLSACGPSSRAVRAGDAGGRAVYAPNLVMPGPGVIALEQRHDDSAPGWEHGRHDDAMSIRGATDAIAPIRYVEIRRRELLWTINGRPREVTREVTESFERRYLPTPRR